MIASGRVKWYRPPEYYSGSRWRGTWTLDGGGAMMNQAIHTVDLLLWMFGPVARVYAQRPRRGVHDIEVEDTAAAVVEFASGALGVIEATTSVYPGYPRRLEVTGTEGTIVIEHDRVVTPTFAGRRRCRRPPPGDANASAVVSEGLGHAGASAHHPGLRAGDRNGRDADLRRPRWPSQRRADRRDVRVRRRADRPVTLSARRQPSRA